MPPHALRVYLVDDHLMFRQGLRILLEAKPSISIVGESEDGAAALEQIRQIRPDVVVLDISLPGLSGRSLAERLHAECPEVKILVLSAHEEAEHVQDMLKAGAIGYIIKRAAADELVRAIVSVSQGQRYLDPWIAGAVVSQMVAPICQPMAVKSALSDRELKVLQRIAQGLPMKKIAGDLEVGVRTVETYKTRAMEKLGLLSRADVIRYAVQHGWLERDASTPLT